MHRKFLSFPVQFTGIVVLFSLLFSSCSQNKQESDYLDGEFWRRQGLTQIIPFWQEKVIDTINGVFYLNLSREGKPLPPFDKYPAMTGRQIYGFTCACRLKK